MDTKVFLRDSEMFQYLHNNPNYSVVYKCCPPMPFVQFDDPGGITFRVIVKDKESQV